MPKPSELSPATPGVCQLAVAAVVAVAILSGCKSKVDEGVDAYKKKDYVAARALFEENQSDGQALLYLGRIYAYGLGVPKDVGKALTLYIAAEEHGSAEAMLAHGKMLLNGTGITRDAETGIKLLEKAGANGATDAFLDIGRFYASKEGGKRGVLAADAYQKAKSASGDYWLSRLYETGTPDIEQDPAKAISLLQASLDRADATKTWRTFVARNLAEFYFWGFGGRPDEGKAIAILRQYPGVETDDFAAWIQFTTDKSQAAQKEAVSTWQRLTEEKSAKYDVRYAYLGLTLAYAAGQGVPHSDLRTAAYREEIMPIEAVAYLAPAFSAKGIYGPKDCYQTIPDENPGRFVRLMVVAFESQVECLVQAKQLSHAHVTAWQAEQRGIKDATAWKRDIERSMSASDLQRASTLEKMLAYSTAIHRR
jgi:TPR repeat protein